MTTEHKVQEATQLVLTPISKSLEGPDAKRPSALDDGKSVVPVFLDEIAGYGGLYENPLPWNK